MVLTLSATTISYPTVDTNPSLPPSLPLSLPPKGRLAMIAVAGVVAQELVTGEAVLHRGL
jgi:hypothetical protein